MIVITALSVIVMFITGMFIFASMFALDATLRENNFTEYHETKSRVRKAAMTFAISSGVFVWSILYQAVYS